MEPLDEADPVVVGPYRLLGQLGEGGMGRVYLGLSSGKRAVAVKVIHADHARDKEFRDRFRVEVAAARKVKAAFTAPVIDAGVDDDRPWLATALVLGPSLDGLVKEQGALSIPSVWRLTAGLAEALEAVHACDVVHRDVTPGNVLLAADGPRLIDFGLSRALGSSGLTSTGMIVGTPAFVSPEHADSKPEGPASDIFSLGSVLTFAATGVPPFGWGKPLELLLRIVRSEPDFRGLSGPLCDLLAWCLAKEPSDRPSPAEIMQAVPDDEVSCPVSPATRFWPSPVDTFVRSYESRFSIAPPENPPRPSHHPPVPFRPPREIAAQAAKLSDLGQGEAARHLLSNTAMIRPGQEVAALITVLRNERQDGDAEIVTSAATRRPAPEVAALAAVLRQIGSGENASQLLVEAGRGSAEDIGAIARVLAQEQRISELRMLLDSAAAAHQQPPALVTLVRALSSAGLGEESARMMDVVAAGLPEADAAALADLLRAAGQQDAAFRMYSAAGRSIARRPPREVAALLRAMRDGRCNDAGDKLLLAVSTASRRTPEVVELVEALCAEALDDDSRRVLAVAASVMTVGEIIVIAESLLAKDRHGATLLLCTEAVASHPVSAALQITTALRDAGRPVDAHQVLESSHTWPATKVAELIASLRQAGSDDDADRVMAAAQRRGTNYVCDLMAGLMDSGKFAAADRMLARVAASSADYCCDLIQSWVSRHSEARPDFSLHWQTHLEGGSIYSCLQRLRRQRSPAEYQLLGFVARRPIGDVVRFARGLTRDQAGEAVTLVSLMRQSQRTPLEAGLAIEAFIHQPNRDPREFLGATARASADTVFWVASALEARLSYLLPEFFRLLVTRTTGTPIEMLIKLAQATPGGNTVLRMLEVAGTYLYPQDFRNFYAILKRQRMTSEARYLLMQAARNPHARLITKELYKYGYYVEAIQLGKSTYLK